MKLKILKSSLKLNPFQFLRGAGYTYIEDRRTGNSSYARPFGNGHYPRFHLYLVEESDNLVFNLHLDQKQASYSGQTMHSGEYDGELVEGEINRLRSLL